MARPMKVLETLVVGVSPEGGELESLLLFLRTYVSWKQWVIDQIWDLPYIPSLSSLHNMFYHKLRGIGFRAHHVKEILKSAREIVKATKKNKGRKPILWKLSARLDKYDAKVDLRNKKITIALLNGTKITLRIHCRTKRLQKFLDWDYYNLILKYDERKKQLIACIYFRKLVVPRKTSGSMPVDINFDNVTLVVCKKEQIKRIKQFRTPLRKALNHKIWAEKIQKKYSKIWRFSKSILNAIRKHHKRARNILTNELHRLANRIVDLADKENCIIVLEKLKGLKQNCKKSKTFNTKLSMFAYRKLQEYIEYKAKERGIPVVYVSARGTSSRCPLCRRKLKYMGGAFRLVVCSCGFAGHRDVVACVNLVLKLGRCVPALGRGRTGLNPMKPRGDVAQKDEAMMINHEYS